MLKPTGLLFAFAFLLAFTHTAGASLFDPELQRRFIAALADVERHDYQAAITEFRRLLAIDPSLHRVRLELARTYFLAGDWDLAEKEFFTVLSADIPEPVRRNIRSFLRQIDERRGWSYDLNFAVISGEGLSRHYRSRTIWLNLGGVPLEFDLNRPHAPALGVTYGGTLDFRKPLFSGGVNILGRLSGAAQFKDFPGRAYDDYTVTVGSGLILAFPENAIDVGPLLSRRWYALKPFEDRAGFRIAGLNRSFGLTTVGYGAGAYAVNNHYSDDRDGVLTTFNLSAERSVFGRATATLFGEIDRLDANADYESYDKKTIGATATADLGFGISGTLSSSLTWTSYDATAPLFFEPEHQLEKQAGVQLTKTNYFFGAYNPYIALDVDDLHSNNALNDYIDIGFRIGLTKAY